MGLKFDGTDDYLTVTLPQAYTTPLTICYWSYHTSILTGDNVQVCIHNNQFGTGLREGFADVLGQNDWARIGTFVGSDSPAGQVVGFAAAVVNKWQFNIATWRSATNRQVMCDGTTSSVHGTSAVITDLQYVEIGRDRDTSLNYYSNQRIAGVALWKQAFSTTEMSQLWNSGVPLDPRTMYAHNLLGYWPLVKDVYDYSGQGNHLTVVSAPIWTNDPAIMPNPGRFRWRPQWIGASGGGDVQVTPSPATSVAGSVNPTVVLGSITIPSSVGSAVAASVAPTTVLGSITIPSSLADSIAASVNPTTVLGSITIPSSLADSIAASVNPTTVLGSITIPSSIASAVAATVDPTVTGGGLYVTPNPSHAVAATANPVVVLGSITIPSSIASTVAASVNPTVEITGGGITFTPDPSTALAAVFGPTVIQSSTTATSSPATAIAATVNPNVDDGGELVSGVIASAVALTYGPFVFSTLGPESAVIAVVIPKPYQSEVIARNYRVSVIQKHIESGV